MLNLDNYEELPRSQGTQLPDREIVGVYWDGEDTKYTVYNNDDCLKENSTGETLDTYSSGFRTKDLLVNQNLGLPVLENVSWGITTQTRYYSDGIAEIKEYDGPVKSKINDHNKYQKFYGSNNKSK